MIAEAGQFRDMISPFLEEIQVPTDTSDRIEIHTSDRNLFRRCRRKWNWQSGLRENLVPLGQAVAPLWFGSGWHFLMEDFHGYRKYPTVDHAIVAYKDAFTRDELPDGVRELLDLMAGMAHYYTEDWLKYHPEPYQTLLINGIPQVEVDYDVDITDLLYEEAESRGWTKQWLDDVLKGRRVVYRMTFDRVVQDPFGQIYILDYKTAAKMDTQKLSNDPQVSAYYWGGAQLYGEQMGGIVWQQHFKGVPAEPEWLTSSNRFSFNKQQKTTYPVFRRAIKAKYDGKIPGIYTDVLVEFSAQQGDWGDGFIRRDILRRNKESRRTEERKIVAEVLDMIDPSLPLYPNPTRDCSWDCPYKDACIAMDDGSDTEFFLTTSFERWKGYKQDWKRRILGPDGQPFYQENQ
jgi:hypothetical protein